MILVATGSEVQIALDARELLAGDGIAARRRAAAGHPDDRRAPATPRRPCIQ
ncbi:hypothetical protein ACPPVO_21020 [Dactylosporangium sp. McL0621]|uniref:hypothetical protein n=1 Tax=Dactylosporangium sp. McL0621 TaxID=3415678 RepID=UPI003CEE7A63